MLSHVHGNQCGSDVDMGMQGMCAIVLVDVLTFLQIFMTVLYVLCDTHVLS